MSTAPDTHPSDHGPEGNHAFYPTHVIDEVLLFYVLLTALLTLAILRPFGLHAEADPLSTPPGIKPEWYFLPMYQFLKYVPEVIGTLGMGAAAVGVILWPFLDAFLEHRLRLRRLWRHVGVAGILVLVTLGVLGHVSEETYHVFGQYVHFDLKGAPHLVDAAQAAEHGGGH